MKENENVEFPKDKSQISEFIRSGDVSKIRGGVKSTY